MLGLISELEIPLDSGDFCLMDRRVVDALNRLPEKGRFVRGLRSFLGFRQVGLEYDRPAREAGRPKYTFRKLSGLAIDGLVSFSSYPLRMVTYIGHGHGRRGARAHGLGLERRHPPSDSPSGLGVDPGRRPLHGGDPAPLSLGIIGEYIRLIFLETKNRPTYIVAELKRHDTEAREDDRLRRTAGPAIAGRSSLSAVVGRSMITTWSQGEPDAFMPEAILTELSALIRRHPWWQARTRLVLSILERHAIPPPARVLDAGCGWGVTLEALEERGYRASGLDVSRQALERLDRPDRRLIEADLTRPFGSAAIAHAAFDAVLALDVIEHLDDDRAALASLGRLVRPGGLMIVSVPALPELFSEFDRVQGHRRRYLPG